MSTLKIWFWSLLAMCWLALPVLAQDAAPTLPLPVQDDPEQLARIIVDAVASKQWWVAVAASVLLATWLVRKYGPKLVPRLEPVLHHPVVSWALPSVLSLVGGIVTTLVARQPLNAVNLIGETLKIAFGAIAMYVGAKKIAEARALGKAAAAGVATKADAVAELQKKTEPLP